MKGNPRQGFVLAVLLHLAVVIGAIVLTYVSPPKPPERNFFQLVSPPPPAVEAVSDPAAVEFESPLVPLPDPVVIPPKPPEPKPEPPPPTPPKTSEVRPLPPPPEPPPQVTFEEYVRQHGQPQARPPRQTPPRTVTPPKIDTKFSANLRETVINLDNLANLTDAEQSALDSYIGRLREALRRHWAKPLGLATTVSAEVEFDVQANGRLINVRISRSSGNGEFDRSVQDAFTALGSAGATPDGRAQKLRLTFRMTDQ